MYKVAITLLKRGYSISNTAKLTGSSISIKMKEKILENRIEWTGLIDPFPMPFHNIWEVMVDGGHIWRNWRIYLTMFAQKIFK